MHLTGLPHQTRRWSKRDSNCRSLSLRMGITLVTMTGVPLVETAQFTVENGLAGGGRRIRTAGLPQEEQ